jgi:uncharacterized protein YjbI with pentapeptide repeats
MTTNPNLQVSEPVNVFLKPVQIDFKGLFKGLAKGIGHTVVGKWEELGNDAVETFSAIGVSTEPGELAFLLLRRSLTKAVFDLVGESASLLLNENDSQEDSLIDQLDFSVPSDSLSIDTTFLDRPGECTIVRDAQVYLKQWLLSHKVTDAAAAAIVMRLQSYFVYALNQEWRRNSKSYTPLLAALQTPFTKAGEREWAWAAYSALLQRRVEEGVFDEPFSLKQVFIPLNAYYLENPPKQDAIDDLVRSDKGNRRVVVGLHGELENWVNEAKPEDAIRVVSGGPGSGKSSFARIFAAHTAQQGKTKVLFVPLHLIDPSKDLADEVGRFVRDEGVLSHNPLDPESPESALLIILDGLDELASQGKAAAETARAFVREVERTVEKRNLNLFRLRVLISGRELIVQENESEFRRIRQVLTLLPYFLPQLRPSADRGRQQVFRTENESYFDPNQLLKKDLRREWWKNYGVLTGRNFPGMPDELSRSDLDEITAQPLLNYLVALSLTREKLDFKKGVGLNAIYDDLVAAVHERGYEKHRPYGPIRHMTLSEFSRVLEEIGLAAWHGDGRTTSVGEIEAHCRASGVGMLLDKFQDGAKAGVTKLLAAFFFRQYGQRSSGDPTFVFTHKSFGEFLAARRIARAIERVVQESEARVNNPDTGWDERDALRHWTQVCGPSAISRYLHVFLLSEMNRIPPKRLPRYQTRLTKLFNYMLRHGMPVEQVVTASFKDALFQSRNAEEALLVALNACARITTRLSAIESSDPTLFGAWFKRIQGQRTGPEPALAAGCLSYLKLSYSHLDVGDFYAADLRHSDLRSITANFASFGIANLSHADLRFATFSNSNLVSADLSHAKLFQASFIDANLLGADLREADLRQTKLDGANLRESNLSKANLQRARLSAANLQGANLKQVKLAGANLQRTNMYKADLTGAEIGDADMAGAVTAESWGPIERLRRMRQIDENPVTVSPGTKPRDIRDGQSSGQD